MKLVLSASAPSTLPPMRSGLRLAFVLLAALSVGATPSGSFLSCGEGHPPTQPSDPPPSNITPDPDALPQCPQDPPYLCWMICVDIGLPALSDQCNKINGPLGAEFENLINNKIDTTQPDELCPQGGLFPMNIKPCDVGITPAVDMSEACKPAPPGCAL